MIALKEKIKDDIDYIDSRLANSNIFMKIYNFSYTVLDLSFIAFVKRLIFFMSEACKVIAKNLDY